MKPASTTDDLGPVGVYRRRLPSAGLSIEANTDDVPADGRYYLLQDSKILFDSEKLDKVEKEYDTLCLKFWQGQLKSKQPEERVQAALALLQRQQSDQEARKIIQKDGSDTDRRRLQEMDRRAAFRNRAANQRAARAAGSSSSSSSSS